MVNFTYFLTIRSDSKILLVENFMENKKSYRVSFKVTTKEDAVSYSYAYFRTNTPPFGGSCQFNRSEGEALVDIFQFTCQGWIDKDTPLTYEIQLPTASGTPIPLYISTNNTAGIIFPLGNKEDGYKLNLTFTVIDVFGAKTMDTITVVVRPI